MEIRSISRIRDARHRDVARRSFDNTSIDNYTDVISYALLVPSGRLASASLTRSRACTRDRMRAFRALDRSKRSRPLRQNATPDACMRTTARCPDCLQCQRLICLCVIDIVKWLRQTRAPSPACGNLHATLGTSQDLRSEDRRR